jgi:hypothetical protein
MDPNPFKHPAILLARIRKAVEPSLLAAGFQFDGRNKPDRPLYLYLDYSRPGDLFRLSWHRRDSNHFIGFTAELLGVSEAPTIIATANFSGIDYPRKHPTTAEVQSRIDSFAEAVNALLTTLVPNEAP